MRYALWRRRELSRAARARSHVTFLGTQAGLGALDDEVAKALAAGDSTALVRTIPRGTQGSFTIVVSPEHLANRFKKKDATLPAVLSTPIMIMTMENAALNAINLYFEAGESTVGTRVDVSHIVATPVAGRIVAVAELTSVAGRRIEFAVRAMDGVEEIGGGTHGRVVIDLRKLCEHLTATFADGAH